MVQLVTMTPVDAEPDNRCGMNEPLWERSLEWCVGPRNHWGLTAPRFEYHSGCIMLSLLPVMHHLPIIHSTYASYKMMNLFQRIRILSSVLKGSKKETRNSRKDICHHIPRVDGEYITETFIFTGRSLSRWQHSEYFFFSC